MAELERVVEELKRYGFENVKVTNPWVGLDRRRVSSAIVAKYKGIEVAFTRWRDAHGNPSFVEVEAEMIVGKSRASVLMLGWYKDWDKLISKLPEIVAKLEDFKMHPEKGDFVWYYGPEP